MQSNSTTPLHVQACNYIREKIYNHEWEVGKKIPTEFELCEQLGMSRGSIKKGIKTLVDEGLLVQYRGWGTFVTESNRFSHPSGSTLLSFAESLRAQGIEFTTEVLGKELIPADDFLSKKLGIAIGEPVFYMRRVRLVEDEPVMYIENRINRTVCPGIEEIDFETEPLFQSLERCSKHRLGFSRVKYAAKVAGEERGRVLKVSEDAPILHLEQHIFYDDDTPTEWGNVWLKANRYVVGTVLLRT